MLIKLLIKTLIEAMGSILSGAKVDANFGTAVLTLMFSSALTLAP